MKNIIETNAQTKDGRIMMTTKEHYFVTEFTVQSDGYYDIVLGYAHDDWESYVGVEVTYPDGNKCTCMQGLVHGKKEMTFPLYFKEGTNKVKFSLIFKDGTEIFYIENKGKSQSLCYEISPKNDVLFKDSKKKIQTFVKNYRDKLKSVSVDDKTDIAFEYIQKDDTNEYSASMADVYPDCDAIYALSEGCHSLIYTFESGKKLAQNIEIKACTQKTDLQFINFNVGNANSTLIHLPNGKNMLIDSATNKKAEEIIIPYLKKNNIKIDYYLLTHFHNDHHGLKDNILEMNSIKKPDSKKCEKLVKKDAKKRYSYLKKFGYLDSSMLCYYDEIHKIWDLGGVEITATNSRFDENGNPTKEYHYSFIKNNEHNYENSTSVSFMLKFKGFQYYHSADTYGICQDRYMSDMIKCGKEKELTCHWFYAGHHFVNDVSARFINTLNPVGVFVPNDKLYHRASYTYYYKENVENYYFSFKRLKDTIVSGDVGSVRVCVTNGDEWYYEVLPDGKL